MRIPEVIVQATVDYLMGDPVAVVRLEPGALQAVRGAIDRLQQIGEATEHATGTDLAKLDEEAADLRETLSDVFTSALEDTGLVEQKEI